ncbi:uroporphyrinogen-III C-methyltransferase [Aliiglaciecola sp. 2_MG-2023]|uniref:uroporphyrinogen-III C-methyltransferase n=1 Tax=unclassified Aliiglaciecola TaxID=2593648 RepID=UPI0026E48CDB|nr:MULTISPECIES: uroporphyrinogen-III C-methyltransferase [unclassified Aliiglaciecola]MDO6710624.1 uroporphyrinogen-III C-methyltransferase [Aliiglaciecola sp. 2_MG-2023]MDO6754289.1 uroporphyrinogen-III C-methyltransferase [Aliiglaciecola sp. 1_MG-2023]
MTEKDKITALEEEMKALEIENASYVEVKEQPKPKAKAETKSEKPPFTPKSKNTPGKDAPAKGKSKTGFLWFVTLINLLCLLAIAAAGYWFWQQWNSTLNNENATLTAQSETISEQGRTIDQLARQLGTQQTEFEESIAKQNELTNQALTQAQANSKNLADVSGRRPADWLLAEADYLVRMAGRKLWLENDVRTAVAMLQAADSRLQDLADPSLLPVRQFIASDIQNLQQINQVSLTSIALSLSGMVQQVNNLPLSLPEVEVKGFEPEELTGMARVWAYIESNFKYQANEGPVEPLLSQQQQWLAKEQLRFALMQAQTAIMKEQDTLFKQSLQRAIGLIVQHYDLETTEVAGMLDALRNLEETEVARKYPQQLDAAKPLQDILENRMSNAFSNGKFEL